MTIADRENHTDDPAPTLTTLERTVAKHQQLFARMIDDQMRMQSEIDALKRENVELRERYVALRTRVYGRRQQ